VLVSSTVPEDCDAPAIHTEPQRSGCAMACTVRLHLDGSLVDFARLLRVLKRHRVALRSAPGSSPAHAPADQLPASVPDQRALSALETALGRLPAVVDAVLL